MLLKSQCFKIFRILKFPYLKQNHFVIIIHMKSCVMAVYTICMLMLSYWPGMYGWSLYKIIKDARYSY
jgi:hypothetical protein